MKKKLFLFITLFSIFSSHTLAQAPGNKGNYIKLDRIIAIVNQEPITSSEFDKELDKYAQQLEHLNQPLPARAELRKIALDNLISKNLQLQLCKKNNIKISDNDINQAMTNIAIANKLSVAQLKQAISQTGLTESQYKEQLREQLTLQKLQQEQISKTVSLTPEDVKEFLKANQNKLNQYSTYHVIDILFPANEKSTAIMIAENKKNAEIFSAQYRKSQDVDALLTRYPGAEKNDLGWRSLAEFPALFQSNIAMMKLNEVSAPIQAPNGFHLLKITEVRGDVIKPTEKELKNLAFQQKAQNAIKEWLQNLRKEAYIKIIN